MQPRGPSKPKLRRHRIDRRAEKVIPDVGRPGAVDAGRDPRPIEVLVAQQIAGAGAEEDADAPRVDRAVHQSGVVDRLRRRADADAVARANSAAASASRGARPRRRCRLRRQCGCGSRRVEHRDRPDTALPGDHPPPRLLARGAQRGDEPDPGHDSDRLRSCELAPIRRNVARRLSSSQRFQQQHLQRRRSEPAVAVGQHGSCRTRRAGWYSMARESSPPRRCRGSAASPGRTCARAPMHAPETHRAGRARTR